MSAVVVERVVGKRARDLFNAWCAMDAWMRAPSPSDTVTKSDIDARAGGRFSVVVKRGAVEIEHMGTFLAFEPGKRLRFTFDAAVLPRSDHATRPEAPPVDVVFEERGAATAMTLSADVPAEHAEKARGGWTRIVDAVIAAA